MSMTSHHSRAMLPLLLVLAATLLVQGNHTTYHHRCKVWKNKCELHKTHCAEEHPKDHILQSCCQPLLDNPNEFSGNDSGIYSIRLGKLGAFGSYGSSLAYCDMDTDNGGWLVIMRRSSSEVNFNERLMKEYEEGFGNLDGDFWFGLKTIVMLMQEQDYELRVDVFTNSNDNNSIAHANYGTFKISGPDYVLQIGNFSSNSSSSEFSLNDGLAVFNNLKFLARREPNKNVDNNCIDALELGGWWHLDKCAGHNGSILTKRYNELSWYSYIHKTSIKKILEFGKYEMKIRQRECSAKLSTLATTTST